MFCKDQNILNAIEGLYYLKGLMMDLLAICSHHLHVFIIRSQKVTFEAVPKCHHSIEWLTPIIYTPWQRAPV